MKSFWQVLGESLHYKQARTFFIVDVVCLLGAFGITVFWKNGGTKATIVLMVLAFAVTYASERLGVYIRVIREDDLAKHGKLNKKKKNKK